MFVSRIRLVIHNLPATLNDAKLRKIVEQHSPPNASIKEVYLNFNITYGVSFCEKLLNKLTL